MSEWTFKKLEASDIPGIIRYFDMRPTLTCDSTVFDTYLWRRYYHPEFCICDDRCLGWRMADEDDVFLSLPLCSAEDLPFYFSECERYSHEDLGKPLLIYGVDEEALELLDLPEDKYRVSENRDYADYLYDAEKLRTLPGKKYHKKKNHINAFLKEYEGRWEYRSLGPEDRAEVFALLDRWRASKNDDVGHHIEAEIEGLEDMFCDFPLFDAHMGGIVIDGRLEAFSAGTYNAARKMAIIHNEKANADIRGLYALINREFLIHEFPDAELVNREDDMGLPGLRKAKESYYPIAMVKKFMIEEK